MKTRLSTPPAIPPIHVPTHNRIQERQPQPTFPPRAHPASGQPLPSAKEGGGPALRHLHLSTLRRYLPPPAIARPPVAFRLGAVGAFVLAGAYSLALAVHLAIPVTLLSLGTILAYRVWDRPFRPLFWHAGAHNGATPYKASPKASLAMQRESRPFVCRTTSR